ncbi:S-layer homology domain-containing protein [Paenibacillus xerothermodurans]|uniref:S-layer homology domain-containing protein n=1 Tax=Paenibacillus xerothermodurans TaxID=1977292 RepID=A0A2W1NLT7_PAEXE|nr:S-layer homology domain-containing protein [Paenibacillus xerothermodurans]PZE19923.1 S-layer homology domain-containing protein [Paenibacillus xerothermodurans]
MIKIVVLVFMLAVSMLSVNATVDAAKSFTDVTGHWGGVSIEKAVGAGYVDGYADGTFRPDALITRAEFIKLAVHAMGFETTAEQGHEWYQSYLSAAEANDLSDKGQFDNLDQPITRLEMARIAVRSTGEKTTEENKWMYLATSKGIITGMDNQGTLGEDQPTTRAQAVKVIERVLALKAGEKLPSDQYAKYAISSAEIAWHKTNVYTMAPEYFGWGKDHNMPFQLDKLRYDGPNGYSEVEKYIIVDMGDPEDPNRKLIPEDMTWDKQLNKTYHYTKDVPANAYAFLSFNHFVVDLAKDADPFRFSHLTVLPFDGIIDNIDGNGHLLNVTSYAPYDSARQGLLWGAVKLGAGHHDVRIVTGQLVPKGSGGVNGAGFVVRRAAAQELGEHGSTDIYVSQVDHGLMGG